VGLIDQVHRGAFLGVRDRSRASDAAGLRRQNDDSGPRSDDELRATATNSPAPTAAACFRKPPLLSTSPPPGVGAWSLCPAGLWLDGTPLAGRLGGSFAAGVSTPDPAITLSGERRRAAGGDPTGSWTPARADVHSPARSSAPPPLSETGRSQKGPAPFSPEVEQRAAIPRRLPTCCTQTANAAPVSTKMGATAARLRCSEEQQCRCAGGTPARSTPSPERPKGRPGVEASLCGKG
jgi:hypothetical protein